MFRLITVVAAIAVSALIAVGAAAETAHDGPPKPTAVCQHGGYADLFAQDGSGTAANPSSTFANQEECKRWVRAGGTVGRLQPELTSSGGVVSFFLTISGFANPVSYMLSGAGTSTTASLTNPPSDQRFQILFAPCTPGELVEVTVMFPTASGGFVRRTVTEPCA